MFDAVFCVPGNTCSCSDLLFCLFFGKLIICQHRGWGSLNLHLPIICSNHQIRSQSAKITKIWHKIHKQYGYVLYNVCIKLKMRVIKSLEDVLIGFLFFHLLNQPWVCLLYMKQNHIARGFYVKFTSFSQTVIALPTLNKATSLRRPQNVTWLSTSFYCFSLHAETALLTNLIHVQRIRTFFLPVFGWWILEKEEKERERQKKTFLQNCFSPKKEKF